MGAEHGGGVVGGRLPRGAFRGVAVEAVNREFGFFVDGITDLLVGDAADAVLGAEERDELHVFRRVQEIDGGAAVAVAAAVIGDEPDAQAAQAGEVLAHEHVDTVEHGAGVEADGFGGEGAEGAAERDGVAFAFGVDSVGEEDDESLCDRIDPQARAGEARVSVGSAGGKPAPARAGERRVDVPAESAPAGAVGLHARHLGDGGRAQNAHAVELSAAEEHPGKTREVGGGGEEPGVTGDTPHGARGGIVDDAAQHRSLDGLGGGDAVELGGGGEEAGVGKAEGQKNFFSRVSVKAEAAGNPHEFTEDDEIDVAVKKRAAGHADEFLGAGALEAGGGTRPRRRARKAGAQAGVVGEELANGDHIFAVSGEGGQVAGDGRVEFEAAALDQVHDGGGGRDRLGEGGGIVNRVEGDGLGRGRHGALAVGAGMSFSGAFEPENAAGNFFGGDRVGYGGVYGGEFGGQKCGRRRSGGRRDKSKQGREQAKEG